jgi:acyl-CoA synthetase (NDP forming)
MMAVREQDSVPNEMDAIFHPQFGRLLTFGLGEILVELFNDVACRMIPLPLTGCYGR